MPEHSQLGDGARATGRDGSDRPAAPGGNSEATLESAAEDISGRTVGPPRPPAAGEALPELAQNESGDAPWPDRMRPLLRTPMVERPVLDRDPREAGAEPRNVARILDLTLRIGELLLASGEAAEDVEAAMLGIARAYRLYPCEPQVTFTLIAISYQPTLTDVPLTVERTVRRRSWDYAQLASVFRLVSDVVAGEVAVDDAYGRLTEIRLHRRPYPVWLLAVASGLLAGAATLLIGGRADSRAWLVFASAFVAAVAGDRLAALVARRSLSEFYQFVIAAMPAALCGILLSFSNLHLRASVVVTGGLFALLPGRSMVAAAQDGLTGFYITAAAHLLEVLYLVAGIVIGVMLVLYMGVNNITNLKLYESSDGTVNPPLQLMAAMLLTLAFAILLQTDRSTLPLVVLNSGIGWTVYGTLINAQVEPIVATGLAAGLIGLSGQMMARYRRTSALPHVTAAIGPLMPGSAMYLGLLSFAQNQPEAGLNSIGYASARAMALAIGVNLGGEVARLFMRMPVATDRLPQREGRRTRGS